MGRLHYSTITNQFEQCLAQFSDSCPYSDANHLDFNDSLSLKELNLLKEEKYKTLGFLDDLNSKKSNYQFSKADANIAGSGARQAHGIVFEDSIIKKYSLVKSDSNTSLFDAKTVTNIPVSIKNNRYGARCGMGDIFRQSTIDCNFILISGGWKNSRTRITPEIIKFYYINDPDKWRKNFSQKILLKYDSLLKRITNYYYDDKNWRENIKVLREGWKQEFPDGLILPAPKRDHKTQKRVQCTLSPKILEQQFGMIDENRFMEIAGVKDNGNNKI